MLAKEDLLYMPARFKQVLEKSEVPGWTYQVKDDILPFQPHGGKIDHLSTYFERVFS